MYRYIEMYRYVHTSSTISGACTCPENWHPGAKAKSSRRAEFHVWHPGAIPKGAPRSVRRSKTARGLCMNSYVDFLRMSPVLVIILFFEHYVFFICLLYYYHVINTILRYSHDLKCERELLISTTIVLFVMRLMSLICWLLSFFYIYDRRSTITMTQF